MTAPESIAVLGGGLTGLSAAFHLSRRFANTPIALVNRDPRLGGWVRSERVAIDHDTHAIVEAGPRTLRHNTPSVLELIHLLGLAPSLLTVPKSAPAARNRFLHIPGLHGIHRIPSSPLDLVSALQAPDAYLGRTLLSSLVREPFKWRNRPLGIDDESVDDFFTRRFGAECARLFGSALVHGIYAADSRKLSLRATFPFLWDAEDRGHGSVLLGSLRASSRPPSNDVPYELGDLEDKMRHVSVYTFQNGMGTLVDALVNYLRKQSNVTMYSGVRIMGFRLNSRTNRFEVTMSSQETLFPTHVVSTLPLPQLQGVLSPAIPLPHLMTNSYSSVTVVNLVFGLPPSSSLPLHPDGFGYLVPRPADGYAATKGSGVLGCVFDSSSTTGQDTPGLVKMTVMLGGPYNSGSASRPVDIPSLLSELAHQLDRPLPSPLCVRVHYNTGCIPLYAVGHLKRMDQLKRALVSEPWNGRMEIVGAGVGGVSVGDCVGAGRSAGRTWG